MTIVDNISRIRQQISAAATRAGRDPGSVRLVAVSKVQPVEAIREAYTAGHRCFGESYVQELMTKHEELADLVDIEWHFIGHLQRNKAKHVVGLAAVIETVDSIRLAAALDKRARAAGQVASVLLQVDVAGEETKSGCTPEELGELLAVAEAAEGLRVLGLMTIPPFEAEAEDSRAYFAALRELRDRHGGPGRLAELSMGMSGDFEVAVEEGSTLVRVGTAVFGPRRRVRG